MFNMCTDHSEIKDFAKKIITERNQTLEKQIKEIDNKLNHELRNLEPKLQKWRLKERKHEFVERIQ